MDIGIIKKIDDKLLKINNSIKNIFECIKNYKWEKLKKMIKIFYDNNYFFDYNIKDENNIYFLEYLILFNKYDILKMVIKNIKIDIVDENYRTILYNIIKYSYIELLNIILIGKFRRIYVITSICTIITNNRKLSNTYT